MFSDLRIPRRSNFVPETPCGRSAQAGLVKSYEDVWDAIAPRRPHPESGRYGQLPRHGEFHHGPSRSGDIEQTLFARRAWSPAAAYR